MASAAPATRPFSPPSADPGVDAWAMLWELALSNKARLQASLAELDLAPTQAHALRLIEPDHPRPMNELARDLMCDNSNVTGVIDRLEARGLVQRRAVEGDRRVKAIALTPEGGILREQVMQRFSTPPDGITSLGLDDRRALRDLLARALGR